MSDVTQFDRSGGPAFPIDGVPGMSLRDYFAAAAMQSVLTWREKWLAWERDDADPQGTAAMVAYEIADAMLAERAK